jgi:hypothetical protein
MSAELSLPDYPAFLAELKERILHARNCAARAVNGELVLLYWDIGRRLMEKQRTAGWGDAVVEMVAADLRRAFPQMTGFSPRNVWDMRRLYATYTAPEFLAQAARQFGQRSKQKQILLVWLNTISSPNCQPISKAICPQRSNLPTPCARFCRQRNNHNFSNKISPMTARLEIDP